MNLPKKSQLLGLVCGGLVIILPSIFEVAKSEIIIQQTTSKVNPCPGIFYEEPHTYRVLVPPGCPPNAFTLELMQLGIIPFIITPLPGQSRLGVGGLAPSPLNPNPSIFNEPPYNRSPRFWPRAGYIPPQIQSVLPRPPFTLLQPPAPEDIQRPSTTIALADGKTNIKLINNTSAEITYQVIGDTAPRILSGKSNITLLGIKTPATVTFQREDGGLLMVTPKSGKEKGGLQVTLQATTDINEDRSSMVIQGNGSVFLN